MPKQDIETSSRGYHIPRTKEGISLILGSATKNYVSWYYQLKIGHGAVETYSARIGVIETPEWWWCGVAEQTVDLNCLIYLYTMERILNRLLESQV